MGSIATLLLVPAWLYRGGSIPGQQAWGVLGNTRILTLLATPLVILAVYLMSTPYDPIDWGLLALGAALFGAAQADGWGRQMDLGSNAKPDDETGHRLRDLIWETQSSFSRDLAGLYMRMAQFIPAGVVWAFVEWPPVLPVLFLVLAAPLVWVAEHLWIEGTPLQGQAPWVELFIGVGLTLSTIGAIWI